MLKNENYSEKTSEWFTEDEKCSFDNSAEIQFGKCQNVFCSKSGNVLKKVYLSEIGLNSKSDRKRRKNFQVIFLPQNIRLDPKNAVLKTVPKFLKWISKHFEPWCRKRSNYRNCQENKSEWSSGDAKCSFENSADHFFLEINNFRTLLGKWLKNFLTEIWFTIKRSSVQIECPSDKRVRRLR